MSDYLNQVEAQLTELTDRGAHQRLRARRPALSRGPRPSGSRPPRRRSEALAVLAAAAVAAAVVAIVVLNVGTGTPRRASAPAAAHSEATSSTTATRTETSTSSQTGTVPGKPVPGTIGIAIPRNFSPQSFTAISELTWWLLGQAPCTFPGEQPPCGEILRTTDGGRSFIGVPAPRVPLASLDAASGYSQIRFADEKNGFAYGPDLYATHDGGVTWTPVDVGGRVADLAISAGQAYAIVTSGTGSSGRLMRSAVGQDQWTAVPEAGEVSGGLWVQGSDVLVQSGSDGPGTTLLVSTDGGATFGSVPTPSPGLPCDFELQSPPVIWARCATGTESGVWVSSEFGKNFAWHGSGAPPLPNSAVFAAASDTTAVVGYQELYRTVNSGATWTAVGPSGIAQWAYVGFTDSTHGVALGYVGSIAPGNERLYYTTDGGQSYHLVPLP